MRNILLFLLVFVSLGATYRGNQGIIYEGQFDIVSDLSKSSLINDGSSDLKELNEIIKGTAESNEMKYLYGWIRVEVIPENVFSIIPSCSVKVWNDEFKVTFNVLGINSEKSYFIIPIGTVISQKEFKIRIK